MFLWGAKNDLILLAKNYLILLPKNKSGYMVFDSIQILLLITFLKGDNIEEIN